MLAQTLGLAILVMIIAWFLSVDNGWLGGRASVGTFNTLLIRGAPVFQERKELLIETLQGEKSGTPDVLCLQEVFRRSDAKDIVEALRSQYLYHASFEDLTAEPLVQPACTPQEAGVFVSCLQDNYCSQVVGTVFINCSLANCGKLLFESSQSCATCMYMELGAAEDADAFARCASTVPANEYTAPYGLLLLSRYPLSDVTSRDYMEPPFVFSLVRGYITAKVEALGLTTFCTHLTADLGVDYIGPPQFSSWDEQQANEVKVIHEVVESTSSIILLGDFNHGPATPGITWEFPLNFGMMTARGLFSANALWCGQCTYCTDNILTGGAPNALIDHIYLPTSRASDVIRVERLFDGIRTGSGLPLSDHYGVRAVINTRRGSTQICPNSDVLGTNTEFLDLDDIDFRIERFCPS